MAANKNLAAAVLAALIATGCATNRPSLVYVPATVPIVHPTLPSAPVVEDVEWQVWNKAAARAAGSEVGPDRVWYVLTPDQFENLMDTLAGSAGFIDKQGNLIQFYRTAIDAHNANVTEQQTAADNPRNRR